MAVKPVPDGYHTVTPYAMVQGAAELIETSAWISAAATNWATMALAASGSA